MASPSYSLLTKDAEFEWTPACEEAFSKLKEALTQAPILKGPDWSIPFHIHIDALDLQLEESWDKTWSSKECNLLYH